MNYIALTGATGLLGSYLMKDLLRQGFRVVALVRGTKLENPRQRVETILHRFEKQLGYPLPRPVVISSGLSDSHLGLDREARLWMARNVDTFLHNAASLEFQHDEKTNEPYRSNIDGTNNVLEFCREQGIRRFHHVSTAYVCGLRDGRVLETELDCGQSFGNAYEESKLKAETAVRQASFLDSVTVHRPAIIVGDSITGYTPTYHGFYAPLKILHPILDPTQIIPEGIAAMIEALGMKGEDEKNFVPVDWISSVMTHIIARPRWHDRCYHLAPANRTGIAVLSDVMAEVLSTSGKEKALPKKLLEQRMATLFETFTHQMGVYRAYWRNDPQFDCTNTHLAAPHLKCPTMDADRMRLLMRFAVRANFGWPRERPVPVPFDVHEYLEKRCAPGTPESSLNGTSSEAGLGLRVTGTGGGDWTIRIDGAGVFKLSTGLDGDRLPTAYLNAGLFRAFVDGRLDPASLSPSDVAWENTDADWIEKHGNVLLRVLTESVRSGETSTSQDIPGSTDPHRLHHVTKHPR